MELLYRICWALGLNMGDFTVKDELDSSRRNKFEMMIVRYSSYFRMLLSMFRISMKQYYELSEDERFNLQKELCASISTIIVKHFRKCFTNPEDEYAMYEMDSFLDEYHGIFEPTKIDAINEEMDRGYEEWMRNNPPDEDDDPFAEKYKNSTSEGKE